MDELAELTGKLEDHKRNRVVMVDAFSVRTRTSRNEAGIRGHIQFKNPVASSSPWRNNVRSERYPVPGFSRNP